MYPFSAIVGQEEAKLALLTCLVEPAVGGALLLGEKGSAKSTLARGASSLVDVPFVNLPLSATEETLCGTIDIAASMREGRPVAEAGLIERAHGGLLYIDEVNLFPDSLAALLVDVASSGIVRLEREGLSRIADARVSLIGSMNPEEGGLRPQFAERFGLVVRIRGVRSLAERVEIVRRRLEFEADPSAFCDRFRDDEERLRAQIRHARKILVTVEVSDEIIGEAARIAAGVGSMGHRGELVLLRTARAIAALDGRLTVEAGDLQQASRLALAHRITRAEEAAESGCVDPEDARNVSSDHELPRDQSDAANQHADDRGGPAASSPHGEAGDSRPDCGEPDATTIPSVPVSTSPVSPSEPETVFAALGGVTLPNIWDLSSERSRRRHSQHRGAAAGRRQRFVSGDRRGRYVRYRLPNDRPDDIAVGASIRAAVRRHAGNGTLPQSGESFVRPEDLRQKVRVRRSGRHILFVVDASGSMASARRMSLAKGAVLTLLTESYQKRDTVGLIAFRGDSAKVVLPPTRSVVLAHRRLRDLPTGGATPLAEAIETSCRLARSMQVKDPGVDPQIVFLTDGRDKSLVSGAASISPQIDRITKTARNLGLRFVWIDTENPWVRVGRGREIAEALDASYVSIGGRPTDRSDASAPHPVRSAR